MSWFLAYIPWIKLVLACIPQIQTLPQLARNSLGWYCLTTAMISGIFSAACILPPEEFVQDPPNYPPHIELDTLIPAEPFIQFGLRCTNFYIEVNDIIDHNDQQLQGRWVVNNRLPGATPIGEGFALPARAPGSATRTRLRIISTDYGVDGQEPSEDTTPILSFFVTDAPQWRDDVADSIDNPIDDINVPPTNLDFGRIPDGDYGVVEVRWTLKFVPGGACP
ncbi:MAG: hypothetical protein KTR25_04955 [Myxococcales bacterium]|nr:hypothetical protein [Myxococcales bacterium]